MTTTNLAIKIDNQSIPIAINKSKRAKYISLRIKAGGEIILTIPPKQSMIKAKEFLNSKKGWILERIKEVSDINILKQKKILIMGKNYNIITHNDSRARVSITENQVHIYGLEKNHGAILSNFLHHILLNKILHYADIYAKQLGVAYNKISLRDTKTRWGSCSSAGNLSFCWRIIFAPEDIIRYLVAHEVSHLIEMNHSKKFWCLVSALDCNYKINAKWLKDNGSMLHRYVL